MKKNLFICFLFLLVFSVPAGEALQYYVDGNYKEALDILLKLENKNEFDYYNIANVYYRLENFSSASKYYLKALNINPGLKEAQHNLKLIYGDDFNRIEWIFVPVNKFYLLNITLFLWLLLLFLICIKFYFGKTKNALTVITALVCLLITLYTSIVWIYTFNNNQAVINVESKLSATPGTSSTVIKGVSPPEIVDIIDEGANYIKIRCTEGITGWINKENVLYIKK
ncbi:MAG: tetratricopeptide repeat protein [Candidatus Muiribacteriota bacterium]